MAHLFAETFEEGGVTAAFANGTQQNTLGEMFYLLSEICKTASKPIVLWIAVSILVYFRCHFIHVHPRLAVCLIFRKHGCNLFF